MIFIQIMPVNIGRHFFFLSILQNFPHFLMKKMKLLNFTLLLRRKFCVRKQIGFRENEKGGQKKSEEGFLSPKITRRMKK